MGVVIILAWVIAGFYASGIIYGDLCRAHADTHRSNSNLYGTISACFIIAGPISVLLAILFSPKPIIWRMPFL